MTLGFHRLTIARIQQETSDCISVGLEVPDALRDLFAFRPGQHVTLRSLVDGEELRRTYSICSAPEDGDLTVAIKRLRGGRFSGWVHDGLKPGAAIEVMPPHGGLAWSFDAARRGHYVAFAAGSGITPIISLLKAGLIREPHSRFTLIYVNRDSSGIIFLDAIATLKDAFMERFRVLHLLTSEEREADVLNGRIDATKMALLTSAVLDPEVLDAAFVCGPAAMMEVVGNGLVAAGLAAERILIERFTAEPLTARQLAEIGKVRHLAQGLRVLITHEGRKRSITFDPALGSILDNARAAGVGLPYACKAGVCATCRGKLISGEVYMNAQFGLSTDDRAQGYVLSCQSTPLGENVALDFDV